MGGNAFQNQHFEEGNFLIIVTFKFTFTDEYKIKIYMDCQSLFLCGVHKLYVLPFT